MDQTWQRVNRDFGSIFSTLLPGAQAKLEPPEGSTWEDGEEGEEKRVVLRASGSFLSPCC